MKVNDVFCVYISMVIFDLRTYCFKLTNIQFEITNDRRDIIPLTQTNNKHIQS